MPLRRISADEFKAALDLLPELPRKRDIDIAIGRKLGISDRTARGLRLLHASGRDWPSIRRIKRVERLARAVERLGTEMISVQGILRRVERIIELMEEEERDENSDPPVDRG